MHVQISSDGTPKVTRETGDAGPREFTDEELEQIVGGRNTITVSYPDGCQVEVVVNGSIWDALDEANDWHQLMHGLANL